MVRQISVKELAMQLENGHSYTLLDVRQPAENQHAALPGSILIPLNELPARVDEVTSLPDQPVVVYCHHGMRSLQALRFLQGAGFTDLAHLRGGIDAYSQLDPSVPRY